MGIVSLLRTGKGPMDGWVARAYDRGVQAAFREIFPRLVADLLDEMRGVKRALDAGCGPGQFTILVAEAASGRGGVGNRSGADDDRARPRARPAYRPRRRGFTSRWRTSPRCRFPTRTSAPS